MNSKTQSSLTFFCLKSFTPALWDQTSVELPTPKPLCWRRQWQPTPVLLLGKSHGQRSLVGCSPWGREESDMTERLLSLFTFMHWRRKWQPTPVFLPGESHRQRSLVGYSPWGHEEMDMTERLHFHFSLSCIGEGNGNPLQCSCLENPRDSQA